MAYTMAGITEELASRLHKELDEPFKRMLADKVTAWRGTLLRRTLMQNPRERVHFRQRLFVKLEKADIVPECIDPNSPTCDIMRSVSKIPSTVRTGILFDYIGSVDGANSFPRASPGTAYYLKKGKYSGRIITHDVVNEYLEIYNAIGLPLVAVDGVFDNPEDVAKFNCATVGQGCDFWDTPYPVSSDIKQAIVECILKVDFADPTTPANKEIEVTPQNQVHGPDGR